MSGRWISVVNFVCVSFWHKGMEYVVLDWISKIIINMGWFFQVAFTYGAVCRAAACRQLALNFQESNTENQYGCWLNGGSMCLMSVCVIKPIFYGPLLIVHRTISVLFYYSNSLTIAGGKRVVVPDKMKILNLETIDPQEVAFSALHD